MAASTPSRALTRSRRKSVASSASNIEPLTGEGDERVLQRGPDGGEAAHADSGQHQLAVAVLGAVAVEAGEHGGAVDAEVGQPEAVEYLGGEGGVVGLDPQLGAARRLQLFDGALG